MLPICLVKLTVVNGQKRADCLHCWADSRKRGNKKSSNQKDRRIIRGTRTHTHTHTHTHTGNENCKARGKKEKQEEYETKVRARHNGTDAGRPPAI